MLQYTSRLAIIGTLLPLAQTAGLLVRAISALPRDSMRSSV